METLQLLILAIVATLTFIIIPSFFENHPELLKKHT